MKGKRFLTGLLTAAMVLSSLPATAFAEEALPEEAGIEAMAEEDGGEEATNEISDAESLQSILNSFGAAGAGSNTLEIVADIDMTGVEWTPVNVDGYNGADVITIEGNEHSISGLTAPLFSGGFAGGSGIIINDLTIEDSEIVSSNTQGSGAFIECVDSMDVITLDNCHLIDSTVNGSRTGGLIGWTSGYDNTNNGAVKTYVTIEDCSVIDCTIDGGTESVGALIGHAGANAWTFTTIEDCTVTGNKLNGGSGKTGVLIGTANIGQVTVVSATESRNTINDEAAGGVYGRFVPGTTGSLTIKGGTYSSNPVKAETDDVNIPAGYVFAETEGVWTLTKIDGMKAESKVEGNKVVTEVVGTLNNGTGTNTNESDELSIPDDATAEEVVVTVDTITAAGEEEVTTAEVTLQGETAASLAAAENIVAPVALEIKAAAATVKLDTAVLEKVAEEAGEAEAATIVVAPVEVASALAAVSVEVTVGGDNVLPEDEAGRNGTVTIALPVTAADETTVYVYHVKGGVPVAKVAEATVAGGKAVFTTNHLSEYAAFAEEQAEAVAEADGQPYTTLQAAVDAAEGKTVTLLGDVAGSGVKITKSVTIDFNNHTYTLVDPAVGSTGTETLGFQLKKESGSVILKNGTLKVAEDAEEFYMMVQNYCDLTLDNMVLDGSNLLGDAPYTLSNNNGDTVITGGTEIIAKEGGFAFDAFYWPENGYGSVTVTVEDAFISGKMELSDDGTALKAGEEHNIIIKGGEFTVDPTAYVADGYIVRVDESEYTVIPTDDVEEGTYTSDPTEFVAGFYTVTDNGNGTWTVANELQISDDEVVKITGATADGNTAKVTVSAESIEKELAAVTPTNATYRTLLLDAMVVDADNPEADENGLVNVDSTEITLTSDLIAALSSAGNSELILRFATYDGDVLVSKEFITALKTAAGDNDITMTLADTTNICAVSNAISVVFEAGEKEIDFPDINEGEWINLLTGYQWDGDYDIADLMVGTPTGKVSIGEEEDGWGSMGDKSVWVSMNVTGWGDYYLTSDEVVVYTSAKDTDDAETVTVDVNDIAEALAAVTPADAEYDMLVLDATDENKDITKITLTSELITALSEAENENLILCLATYRYDGEVLLDKEFITALKAAAGNHDITMTLADVVNSNAISSPYGFNAYNVVFEANGKAITFPSTGWIGLNAAYVLYGYDMADLMVGTPKGKVPVGVYSVIYTDKETPEVVVWVSMDMTAWGDYYLTQASSSSGGNSGGGGGGGSSKPSTSTTTNKNEDGSTTTTTTNTTTGTVTEKTENTDGSTVTVETKADGTVTATVEGADGSKATMETKTDGTITTTAERADGVTTQTVETSSGNVTSQVTVPANVEQAVVTIPVAAEVTPGLVAMDAATGEIIKLSVPTEGGVNVALNESANIVLVDNSKDFADTTGHWGSDAVDFVSSRNIMNGVDGQSFDPDSDLTRGQIATILRNIETNPAAATEAPSFGDVAEGHWAAESVAWAAENGFVSGYDDGTYGVNDSITREQLASILYRYAGAPAVSGSLAGFADNGSVSGYAQNAMIWATQQGLISGVGENTLDPQGNATRVQVASIIMRYISSLAK